MRKHEHDFDCEHIYDTQIEPHLAAVLAICQEHNMPFIASVMFSRKGDECGRATVLSAEQISHRQDTSSMLAALALTKGSQFVYESVLNKLANQQGENS